MKKEELSSREESFTEIRVILKFDHIALESIHLKKFHRNKGYIEIHMWLRK